jgi:hypothetical protein
MFSDHSLLIPLFVLSCTLGLALRYQSVGGFVTSTLVSRLAYWSFHESNGVLFVLFFCLSCKRSFVQHDPTFTAIVCLTFLANAFVPKVHEDIPGDLMLFLNIDYVLIE